MKFMFALLCCIAILYASTFQTFAQDNSNSGESQLYNAAKGTNNPQTPSLIKPPQLQLHNGVNLLWLLPLLTIPIVFLIFRVGERTGQNNIYKYSSLAGAKGGKAIRKRTTKKKNKVSRVNKSATISSIR